MNVTQTVVIVAGIGSGGLVPPSGYAFVVDDNSPHDYIVDDNNPSNYIAEPV